MKIVLYTYQSKEAVEVLKKTGVLKLTKADRKLTQLARYDNSDYNFFEFPYKYMIHEMENRLPKPIDSATYYPIWAWYKVNGRYNPSKLLDKIHEGMYRLKVEIDNSRVLLSDFDLFASIISGTRYFDLKKDKEVISGKDYDAEFDEGLKKIFELHRKKDDYYGPSYRKETIQATFWELFIEDVVEIKEPTK